MFTMIYSRILERLEWKRMKEQAVEVAASKTAIAVGVGAATAPTWVQFVNGDTFAAIMLISGLVASASIIAVNVVNIYIKLRNSKAN